MGVKLLAWVGGLALFLALAFFVKYSFEYDFITPEMRVVIGFITGAGLLAGGLHMSRRGYVVLGQTWPPRASWCSMPAPSPPTPSIISSALSRPLP